MRLKRLISGNLLEINKNKDKEKESLEKSQEIEKHHKIQENLKSLNAYIKKLRYNPQDEQSEPGQNDKDSSINYGDVSKSGRQYSKRSDQSKRHNRANNRSRLYEDEQKLFDNIVKTKNNQSLDMKIDQKLPKHIKYTTLLSKDKKLKLAEQNNANQNVNGFILIKIVSRY